MPEPIAGTAYFRPWLIGTNCRTLVTEANGGLADYEELALDGGNGFWVGSEGFEVHASHEFLDVGDRIEDVLERSAGVLKRQEWLPARHARGRGP